MAMPEETRDYRNWLGRTFDPDQAHLYEVLGLPLFEEDRTVIQSALDGTVDRLKLSRSRVEKGTWEQVVALVQKAKGVLLDPSKKVSYDQRLRKSMHLVPIPAELFSNVALPDGDPSAPFDMASYVQSSTTDDFVESDTERLLEELRQELGSGVGAFLLPGVANPVAADPVVATPISALPVSANVGPGVVERRTSAPIVANGMDFRQIRSKKTKARKSNSTLLILGAFGCLAFGLFAVGAWLLIGSSFVKNDRRALAQSTTIRERSPSKATNELPKPTIFEGAGNKFDLPTSENGASQDPAMEPPKLDSVPSTISEGTSPSLPSNPPTNSNPPTPAPTTPAPSTPAPSTPAPTTPAPNTPAPASSIPATDAPVDSKKIAAEFQTARRALMSSDFETLEKIMNRTLPLASSPPWKDRFARLDQLGQLWRIFREGIDEAVGKLKGGDSLKVGSTMVAFVEGNKEYVIFRIAGNNERFALDNLPLGIGLGLADLSLSSSAPTDLGARAAFCILQKKPNAISKSRGQEFLSKASASGKIRSDLMLAIEEVIP